MRQYQDLQKEREAEEKRKYPLERRLKEKLVGQEAAINAVAAGIIYLYYISMNPFNHKMNSVYFIQLFAGKKVVGWMKNILSSCSFWARLELVKLNWVNRYDWRFSEINWNTSNISVPSTQ